MRAGTVRIVDNGPANQFDCKIVASNLAGDEAEVVQRVGMAGLRRENFAVKRLSLHETSSVMVLECKFEDLLDRSLWHGGHSVSKEDTDQVENAIP